MPLPPIARLLPYSMTSSARASSAGGTSSPSALAVFRLMTSLFAGALGSIFSCRIPTLGGTHAPVLASYVNGTQVRLQQDRRRVPTAREGVSGDGAAPSHAKTSGAGCWPWRTDGSLLLIAMPTPPKELQKMA